MAILVYAEHSAGKFKKATLEACTYAADLAAKNQDTVCALLLQGDGVDTAVLAKYGVNKVIHMQDAAFAQFSVRNWIQAMHSAAQHCDAKQIVLSQSYNGRAIAPGLSIRLNAALISGVTSLPENKGNEWHFVRTAYSGKGIETLAALSPVQVITVKANGYKISERPTEATTETLAYTPSASSAQAVAKDVIRASSKISLTEADVVVSGGRGLKGPENWGLVEDLANLLGAATACSKPVSDVDWRPHHEHVGQTGIQIAPNLYIAIGISGAIQHLAGVNSSKVIVVINKDAEAPFFKAADYGIVGDAFEVVPRITKAIEEIKKAG
jgi:electron transfer flavoprotein alpha subunit